MPLATGGSAMKAVEVIMEHGVPEERIIFINLVSIPQEVTEKDTKFLILVIAMVIFPDCLP